QRTHDPRVPMGKTIAQRRSHHSKIGASKPLRDVSFFLPDGSFSDRDLDMMIVAARGNAIHFDGKSHHQIHANNYTRYAKALTQVLDKRDAARAALLPGRIPLWEDQFAAARENPEAHDRPVGPDQQGPEPG